MQSALPVSQNREARQFSRCSRPWASETHCGRLAPPSSSCPLPGPAPGTSPELATIAVPDSSILLSPWPAPFSSQELRDEQSFGLCHGKWGWPRWNHMTVEFKVVKHTNGQEESETEQNQRAKCSPKRTGRGPVTRLPTLC